MTDPLENDTQAHIVMSSRELQDAVIALKSCDTPEDIKAHLPHVLALSERVAHGPLVDPGYTREEQNAWADLHPAAGDPEQYRAARDHVADAALQLAASAQGLLGVANSRTMLESIGPSALINVTSAAMSNRAIIDATSHPEPAEDESAEEDNDGSE